MFNPWRKLKKLIFLIYGFLMQKLFAEDNERSKWRNGNRNSSRWRRRTFIEKILLILLSCAVFAITILIINIWSLTSMTANRHSGNVNSNNVCLSEGCIHKASKMLKYMDRNVNPCDNFYKFACGKFLETKIIPTHKTVINDMEFIAEELEEQMKIILEQEAKSDDFRHVRLVKILYNDCLNETAIDKNSLQTALDILKRVGGWPVLEGKYWNDKDWIQLAYKLREEGHLDSSFFKLNINSSFNETRKIISIEPPPFSLLLEDIMTDFSVENFKSYFNFIVDIAVIFGANKAEVESEMILPLKLEMKLADNYMKNKVKETETNNIVMTIKELQDIYPSIPWKEYINTMFKLPNEITEEEEILIIEPGYFRGLESIMFQFTRRDHANYMLLDAVKNMISFLNDDVKRRTLMYETKSQIVRKEARWKECLEIAKESMDRSMDALYIKKFFSADSKNKTVEMVINISKKYKTILQNIDWMDSETKERIMKKMTSMGSYIAYIDDHVDNKKVDEFYDKLEIVPGNHLQTIFNLKKFNTDDILQSLRKPSNRTSWIYEMTPRFLNALYMPHQNFILIPAALLQGVFYIYGQLRYIYYGEIGFVIGHELYHAGFDVRSNGLFEKEAEETFMSKIRCILRQYGNYTDEEIGMNLNGNGTLFENIADNGGIKLSYLAYQEWAAKQNGPEPSLPGLDFTPSQLFWISAAQGMCTKYKPKYLEYKIRSDSHSPEEFRITGSLSNILEFAEDFQCQEGSNMNPKNKCSVW